MTVFVPLWLIYALASPWAVAIVWLGVATVFEIAGRTAWRIARWLELTRYVKLLMRDEDARECLEKRIPKPVLEIVTPTEERP